MVNQRMAPYPSKTIYNLQALRALAALMVVFAHQTIFLVTASIPFVGVSGVDLFFVISGFIMVWTTRSVGPVDFLRSRISRIVPIYWSMTLAVYLLALVKPDLLKGTSSSLSQLAMSFLFIPFIKPSGAMQPILFVGWTLNYEMFFYVIFSAGLCFRRRLIGLSFTGTTLAALVFVGLETSCNAALVKFYTDPIILEFVLGMAIALITERLPTWSSRSFVLPLLVLATTMLSLSMFLPLALPTLHRLTTMGLPAAILVAAAITLERGGVRCDWQPAVLIGNASYSIYLIHPFATEAMQKLLKPDQPFVAVLCVVATMVLVCVCGITCWRWVEQPSSKLARRILC